MVRLDSHFKSTWSNYSGKDVHDPRMQSLEREKNKEKRNEEKKGRVGEESR